MKNLKQERRQIMEICKKAYDNVKKNYIKDYCFDINKIDNEIMTYLLNRNLKEIVNIMKLDLNTYEHCFAVAKKAREVAKVMCFNEDETYHAGLLHDIGKIFNGNYNKSSFMSENEKAEHVIIADIFAEARLLNNKPLSFSIANTMACHHDRIVNEIADEIADEIVNNKNGIQGYPHKNPMLSIYCLIVQPVDTWHAMAERGGYQRTYSNPEIIDFLKNASENGLYAKTVVDALCRTL